MSNKLATPLGLDYHGPFLAALGGRRLQLDLNLNDFGWLQAEHGLRFLASFPLSCQGVCRTRVALSLYDLKGAIDVQVESHVCLRIIRIDNLLGGWRCISVVGDRPVVDREVVLAIMALLLVH